jgi:hypothetical protein
VVVAQLSKSVHQIEHSFYESENILSLSVDTEQLYPPPASASMVSPLPVLVQRSERVQPEVPSAGDLITPMPTLRSTTERIPRSADDTVNIIMVGWADAKYFAQGIINWSQ